DAVAAALGGCADALLSLGGLALPDERVAALRRTGVEVVPYADTWDALGEADVFVTSQGMNSTHEAAFSRVPMLSYPFFADQPDLAERCASFGIGVPLVEEP